MERGRMVNLIILGVYIFFCYGWGIYDIFYVCKGILENWDWNVMCVWLWLDLKPGR